MQVQKTRPGYKLIKSLFGKYEEIPEEWNLVKFGEYSKIKRGASPRPIEDPKYFGQGRGWIRISDVSKSFKYLEETNDYLSELGESKSVSVNPGDIVMSIAATVGRPIILKMKACIHDGFIVFSELSKEIDNEFLYYLLKRLETKFSNMGQHGTQGNINSKLVSETKFAKPPLKEQQKIASILSNVDSLINQTQKEIDLTKKLKKGLMNQLLTKGIGHKKFKKVKWFFGKKIDIPEDWEILKLSKLCEKENDIVAGPFGSNLVVNDYITNGVPIIRLQNIDRNQFIEKNIKFIGKEKAEELKYHSYMPEDLVLAKLGDPIGKTCRIPKDFPAGIVVADVVRIRTSLKKSDSDFIEYVLNSWICEKQFNMERIGTTRPRVNLKQIRNLVFPCPPLKEQQKIASILSNIDSYIQTQQDYKNKLESLKKGLMQKLLTGQIRVSV